MNHSRSLGQECLIFLHIPKTGGTSVIQSLCDRFPEAICLTDRGNLSKELLVRQSAEKPRARLLYGHPHHDIMDLVGNARLMTLLRRPEAQAVSNYLHIQRSPEVHLHRASLQLDFPDFLRTHWQCLVFQAISLDVARSKQPITSQAEFFRRLPGVKAMLDRIDIVGSLDTIDDCLDGLAETYGGRKAKPSHWLNTAREHGVEHARIAELRMQYRSLWHDPQFVPLLAVEEDLYAQACKLSRLQLARICRKPSDLAESTSRGQPAWKKVSSGLGTVLANAIRGAARTASGPG